MSTKDVELNEFIEEVTDGTYKLTCKEVILKIVKDLSWMHDWASLLFNWKTTSWSQEKDYGKDVGKHIEDRNQYQLPTCDDKGVFTDDDDTKSKRHPG